MLRLPKLFATRCNDEISGRIRYSRDDEAGAEDAGKDAEGDGRTAR
jgi:hypothetical protein